MSTIKVTFVFISWVHFFCVASQEILLWVFNVVDPIEEHAVYADAEIRTLDVQNDRTVAIHHHV